MKTIAKLIGVVLIVVCVAIISSNPFGGVAAGVFGLALVVL